VQGEARDLRREPIQRVGMEGRRGPDRKRRGPQAPRAGPPPPSAISAGRTAISSATGRHLKLRPMRLDSGHRHAPLPPCSGGGPVTPLPRCPPRRPQGAPLPSRERRRPQFHPVFINPLYKLSLGLILWKSWTRVANVLTGIQRCVGGSQRRKDELRSGSGVRLLVSVESPRRQAYLEQRQLNPDRVESSELFAGESLYRGRVESVIESVIEFVVRL
jgi:hypothetical protein